MGTVRRLYFYGLALIAFEVVIWGVINLLRTIFGRGIIGAGGTLATGISLVLVGLPVFLFHWRIAQRDSARDLDERDSRIRAVFLYAALFATLTPLVYAVLALVNRALIVLLGGLESQAWFGGGGSALDNLIALLVNGVSFLYFWAVLRGDWRDALARFVAGRNAAESTPPGVQEDGADVAGIQLTDARRLYRYALVLFGLSIAVAGVYNLLRFFFSMPGTMLQPNAVLLAGAISMLLTGALVWAYFWRQVQASLDEPEERRSLLRLLILYIISLAGVVGVLTAAGSVINAMIRWIAGENNTLASFFQGNSAELAAAIALGGMWAYYGQIVSRESALSPSAVQPAAPAATANDQPRRKTLRRLYETILALLGLAITYAGLLTMIDFLSQLLFGSSSAISSVRGMAGLRGILSNGLSAVLVGLPLWLIPWQIRQAETVRKEDRAGTRAAGSQARRSVIRRAHLYLVLFLLVVGVMVFTGRLLYNLINAILPGPVPDEAAQISAMAFSLVITTLLLMYHRGVLSDDARAEQQIVGGLHAAFPTLVLLDEEDEPARVFTDALLLALPRTAVRLPVAVHAVGRGAPDETMLNARAIVLPARLAVNPPESLRLWLNEYRGERLIVPLTHNGWHWVGAAEGKRVDGLAREAASTLRQMAEGEALRLAQPGSPWSIAGYVLGGLFGLQVLILLFSLMVSFLFR
jgi:hypothetical protein